MRPDPKRESAVTDASVAWSQARKSFIIAAAGALGVNAVSWLIEAAKYIRDHLRWIG